MAKISLFLAGGGLMAAVVLTLTWQPVPDTPTPARPLLAGATAPPPVMNVVERSCQDCHSERTRWPWYARVKPVASVLLSDVSRGRHFLNFSQWDGYSRGQKLGFLTAMSAAANTGRMPPRSYAFLHPQSRLSDAERLLLRTWAKDEAARLRHSPNTSKPQS